MATVPLLSEDDRKEVIRLYTEMGDKYNAIDAAIKAGKPAGELKTALDKIDEALTAIRSKHEETIKAAQSRLDAIEEVQRRRAAEPETPKSIGQQVIEHKGFVDFVASKSRGSFSVLAKGPLFQQKDITGLSRALPEIIPQIGIGPRMLIGVRTLIPLGRTTAGSVSYVEETSFAGNAAPVAEGAAKPKSDKVFTPRTLPVETIAHYFKVSRQSWEDLPFVASQIEANGIFGVQFAEDNQLLNGTGVSPQLKGLNPIATAAPAPGAGSNLVDAIGAAIFNLAAQGFMADGTVVNPADWGAIAMTKNLQGTYLFANPIDYAVAPRVWGTRLVQSAQQAAGTFLVGAFQGHSLLVEREDITVQVATQNEDDFIKNMVTILVEERVALLPLQPKAFTKGVTPAGA